MKEKSKFEPCEVSIKILDMLNDVIVTSAHDAPEVWFDDDSDGILGGN